MIYNVIQYCGEENILDIRLNTIGEICDKIIILEGSKSHTGIPRELEFPKQKDRFSKFLNKIQYIGMDYYIPGEPLLNDWRARLILQEILTKDKDFNENSIILSDDNDEIIRPDKLLDILNHDKELIKPYTFMMDNRILCFNIEPVEQPGKFPGTILLKGKHLNEIGDLCHLRQIRANPIINGQKYNNFNIVMNGGLHFSYANSIDATVKKFSYYSHASETGNWTKDKEGLINCIKTKTSFTPEKGKLKVIEWKEENFPSEIFNNPEKYKENLSSYYE